MRMANVLVSARTTVVSQKLRSISVVRNTAAMRRLVVNGATSPPKNTSRQAGSTRSNRCGARLEMRERQRADQRGRAIEHVLGQ